MIIKTILKATFLLIVGLSLASCQTMNGLGKDVKSVGESIEGAAE